MGVHDVFASHCVFSSSSAVKGFIPLNAPKPSILTFLMVISTSSPSLSFLVSTSFLGMVMTRDPPTFRVLLMLIAVSPSSHKITQ